MDNPPNPKAGAKLRAVLASGPHAFIGVYDLFSATLAAKRFPSLFVSGFSFAASHYGLPDIGFIGWPDIVAFVQRLRIVLPAPHLLVDIDDGYGDPEIACHVVSLLETANASAVVLEDQKRPRRCGHFDGKCLLELDQYIAKLKRVLDTRTDLLVVARTDATDEGEILERVAAFGEAGADAILVDGVRDLRLLDRLRAATQAPLAFNQIAGGKSPPCTLDDLAARGVSIVIYSTPCLFAAQAAIEDALAELEQAGGRLPDHPRVGVANCTAVLRENLARRDQREQGERNGPSW